MDFIRGLLEQQPLMALFLTIAIGYLVGEINLKGFSLGAGAVLFVANHVSWVDIVALHSQRMVGFVAKREIAGWPVVGWLAARGETIFHQRGSTESLGGVLEEMVTRLREGRPVAVFPEATTSDGSTLLPFYGNLLEAAIAEHAPVIPIALRYLDAAGDPAAAAVYVGDTTFVESLWMVLGERVLVVDVQVLAPVPSSGRNRHDLARELRGLISCRLGLPTADTSPGTAAAFRAASR